MAAQASWMSPKKSSPVDLWGSTGTVSSTASAMKASVPSEPTRRWAKRSTGRS